jgi:hypothetical protein
MDSPSTVTVINEKYIIFEGCKYRKMKARIPHELTLDEKKARKIYMKEYRRRKLQEYKDFKRIAESIY